MYRNTSIFLSGVLKLSIKKTVQKASKFLSLRLLLPACYNLNKHKKINDKKVVFIEKHADSMSDNFALINKALEERGGYDIKLVCLRLGSASTLGFTKNSMKLAKEVADAKYVFYNDALTVYSCLPLKKETMTFQVWHACGAFKRFGADVADSKFGNDEAEMKRYPHYANTDYVTVSSSEIEPIYEHAMLLSKDKGQRAIATGISRTDAYFDKEKLASARQRTEEKVPQAHGKKIWLYAPTFRGSTVFKAQIPKALDIEKFCSAMPEDTVLLIKHHPFAHDKQQIPENCADRVFDVTDSLAIDDLLMTADLCITDYSSLIFEYSLMDKPMVFFAYDIDEYLDERGFYYPFEEFCPGPIVKTTDELIEAVNGSFDMKKIAAFRDKFMSACDGHATERILALMDEGKN